VIHAMFGGAAPRASGGFTVYRPWHWSLEGSDLYFGDVIGGRPDCIAAYEIDGCDFTMRDGLPYPTGKDGAPDNLAIVAMAPAIMHEEDHFQASTASQMNSVSTPAIKGDGTELPHLEEHEGVKHPRYGAGMIASHDRGVGPGDGTVFVAGSASPAPCSSGSRVPGRPLIRRPDPVGLAVVQARAAMIAGLVDQL
jgi:hypothetical protein